MDGTIVSLISEYDPYLTMYVTDLVKTGKTERQKNKVWFPTHKNLGRTKDHNPTDASDPQ